MNKGLVRLMEMLENIKVEYNDGIAFLIMNRPKALNALNNKTLDELEKVFEVFEESEEIKGIIITGTGKSFVAGADIVQIQNYKSEEGRDYAGYAQDVFNKIESIKKPVIAAINGYALGGGCELAMCCDLRIASEKAVFAQPEVKLGVIPCFGGTQRLTRLVGAGRAKDLIYTARHIKPDEALSIGLINRIVSEENLLDEAKAYMEMIIGNAPMAIKYAKMVINKGMDLDLKNALELEKDAAGLTFATEDKQEGMTAFLEKRPPAFRNR